MIITYNQFATYYVSLLLCKRVDVHLPSIRDTNTAHASGPARCLVRSSTVDRYQAVALGTIHGENRKCRYSNILVEINQANWRKRLLVQDCYGGFGVF